MLKKLFGSREKGSAVSASVPDGCRLYVVGDVHGRVDLLQRIREKISADAGRAAPERKVLIHLGDYVDRGESSRQVVDLCRHGVVIAFSRPFSSTYRGDSQLQFG